MMVAPYKRQKKRRHKQHRKEGNVKTEAGTGVMLPQAKQCQEPPEAGRCKKKFSPKVFRRNVAQATP